MRYIDILRAHEEHVKEAALVTHGNHDLMRMIQSLFDKWQSGKHSEKEVTELLAALGYKITMDGDRAEIIKEAKGDIRKLLVALVAAAGAYGMADDVKQFGNELMQNVDAAMTAEPHPGRPDPQSDDALVRQPGGVMRNKMSHEESYEDDDAFFEAYGWIEDNLEEAEYQGRKVKLNKPMQGDVKKFKVYVKDPKTGNVKKVNFGHGGSSVKGKSMRIRKNNPKARKNFRARHNCDNPGPKTKARYWSCRKW